MGVGGEGTWRSSYCLSAFSSKNLSLGMRKEAGEEGGCKREKKGLCECVEEGKGMSLGCCVHPVAWRGLKHVEALGTYH